MKQTWHLLAGQITVAAGKEWSAAPGAWKFVRLSAGEAYWIATQEFRALSEREVIVIPPTARGTLRASQLGDVRLDAFTFHPEQVCGLLSFTEREYFAQQRATKAETVRVLTTNHPAVDLFTALAVHPRKAPGLAERVHMMRIVAAVFDEDLSRHTPLAPATTPALQRFRQLIARIPETELTRHTPLELAESCGCTARHLTRMFRQHFGKALREYQTELRLLAASHLLIETEAKIIDVAFESGYRSLSLFNALFKRKFGATPSEWRRNHAPDRSAKVLAAVAKAAALLCLGAFMGGARAAEPNATPPKHATTTNSPAQTSTTAGAVGTFEVKAFQLQGNTLLPLSVTGPILEKHTGPAVTFESIRQALADLQLAYRDRGFISVAVSLPPQQLTNGIVRVQVTEGRLAEITIQGNRYFSSNSIMRALPSLRTNIVLNSLVFQQELDRANANQDRQIYPVINPGPDPGTSALDLKIKDRLPLHGRVELDNYSTPGTPELRSNVAAQYNNLWQLDHQLGVQYSLSPEELKRVGGFPFYELPLVANYSAFYRMPLSPINGPVRGREYELSDFGYDEVTRRFRPPPVSNASELLFYASRSVADTGRRLQSETLTPQSIPPEGTLQVRDQIFSQALTVNENVGARWQLPLPDFLTVRSSLSLGPDFKNFRAASDQDRTFQATVFVPEIGQTGPPFTEFTSPPTSSSRSIFSSLEYLPVTLLWEGSAKDTWGVTSFSLNQSAAYGALLSDADAFRAVAGSEKANGNYYVVTAAVTRDQKIAHDWGVRLHADGQWANQPLISNEQFALGGLAGVRGYRDGEEYGDTGWRVQFEPHTPYLTVGVVNKVPITARLYTFVDYGKRYLIDPGPRQGSIEMLGLGGGLDSSIGNHVSFRVAVGVPALDVPGRKSGDARASFSVWAEF